MSWWRRYFPDLEDESVRLRRLADERKTVALRDVSRDDSVVVIAFGYGDEFWRVDPDFEIDSDLGEIRNGRLIVADGIPLRDRARLSFLRTRITRLSYRV